MAVKKLNVKTVERLVAPTLSGKQEVVWDTELKGWGVLLSGVSNSRTFIVQRALPDGRMRRVTIGATNEITLEVARTRAADALDAIRRGIDPKEKIAQPATLQQALEDYLSSRKDLRPATVRVYRTVTKQYLKPWLEIPVKDITADMVEARHRAIAAEVANEELGRKGEVAANMAMRVFRVLWNFLADRVPGMGLNPTRRLHRQWFAEPRRERIVPTEAMPKFFECVSALDNHVERDFILLLMFSGLRLGEASSLTWEDIDLPSQVIRISAGRTKAKRKLDLPMSDFVHDLLVARRAIGRDKFVFPGPGKKGHISDARAAFKIIEEKIGLKLSPHDLRRGYLTCCEQADLSMTAMKLLANHSTGRDVTSGYIIMSQKRLAGAAQKVAEEIKRLCGVVNPTGENVARLNR